MKATVQVDSAGRIVLPKAVRDRLGLAAGTKLEVEIIAERIELTPLPDDGWELVRRGKRLVMVHRDGRPFDAAAAIRAERDYQATMMGVRRE